MSNFYLDNPDIEKTIDALDLSEVATLLEQDFKFAKEYDFAPTDVADAIDNYKRALSVCGDIIGNRIASTAEETDRVGNVLNEDGFVNFTKQTLILSGVKIYPFCMMQKSPASFIKF